MQVKIFLSSLVAGILSLSGCSGVGGGSIVGSWEMNCTQEPDQNLSVREEITFASNGTYSGRNAIFRGAVCSQRLKMYALDGRYETGGATEGDDGKPATEIKLYNSKSSRKTWQIYSMYKLTDSDTLLMAGGREGYDGTSEARRRDHFYGVWKRK